MATKCIVNKATLTDIANAIREKDGSTDTILPSQMAQKISDIPSGGDLAEAPENDVCFYRPDGFRLYSFTKDEVLADGWNLPEIPEWTVNLSSTLGNVPVPMEPQEWNYTRDQVIENVNMTGLCCVSGIYIPTDRKTYIRVVVVEGANNDVRICFRQGTAYGVTVDWGDGSNPETYPESSGYHNRMHTYAVHGVFVITLSSGTSGGLILAASTGNMTGGGPVVNASSLDQFYAERVSHVLIGGVYQSIECAYTFNYMRNLEMLTLPQGAKQLGSSSLMNTASLKFIGIPSTVTSYMSSAVNQSGIEDISLPCTVKTIPATFVSSCPRLNLTALPYVIKTLSSGISSSNALRRVVLPDNIGSLPASAFYTCFSLTYVRFPAALTDIASGVFYNCYSLILCDFRRTTQVPALANVSAFKTINEQAKIVVPDSLYDEWIVATNWSDSSIVGKIVKASEYEGG